MILREFIPSTSEPIYVNVIVGGGRNETNQKVKDTCNYDQSKGFNRTVQMLQNRGHDVWRR